MRKSVYIIVCLICGFIASLFISYPFRISVRGEVIKPINTRSYYCIRLDVPYKYNSLFYKTRHVEIEFDSSPEHRVSYDCNLIDRKKVVKSNSDFFYAYVEMGESVVKTKYDECTGHLLIDDLNIWRMLLVRF